MTLNSDDAKKEDGKKKKKGCRSISLPSCVEKKRKKRKKSEHAIIRD